jgi:DNA-directed RNA polymerase subunit RPC12/RpoP
MDRRDRTDAVDYICWNCGDDFAVDEHDGLPDRLVVLCPNCGSDLVAVDFAAVRHSRTGEPRRGSAVHAQTGGGSPARGKLR